MSVPVHAQTGQLMTRDEKGLGRLFSVLADPFTAEIVEWQIVHTKGQQAFVLPFVDACHYVERLNSAAPGWSHHIEFVFPECQLVKYRLVIEGVSRLGIGEDIAADPTSFVGRINRAMVRACQAFGLGRYLLCIPGAWVDYHPAAKSIRFKPRLPAWALPGGAGVPPRVIGKLMEAIPLTRPGPHQPVAPGAIAQKKNQQPKSPAAQLRWPARDAEDPVADAQALKAYGELYFQLKRAGLAESIQPVVPPITFGDLRRRSMEICELMAVIEAQNESALQSWEG